MMLSNKELAIKLRREGRTYSEILAKIPVAKSTLSIWLRSVNLSKPQIQRVTKLRTEAALRGAHARKSKRVLEVDALIKSGKKKVGLISERELWLIGVALYWAEGSKQNSRSLSTGVIFANSDPDMVKVFLRWLRQIGVSNEHIVYELYIHRDRQVELPKFKSWWARKLGIKLSNLDRVYIKPGNPQTRRSNAGDLYHGLVRIKVKSSTALNRRIGGWIAGIAQT